MMRANTITGTITEVERAGRRKDGSSKYIVTVVVTQPKSMGTAYDREVGWPYALTVASGAAGTPIVSDDELTLVLDHRGRIVGTLDTRYL